MSAVTTPDPPAPVPPVPAGTVALLRPGRVAADVLLIHRPGTMAFGPGLHVFPGGKVDADDTATDDRGLGAWAAEQLGRNVGPDAALAVHRAAVRELREEVGIELRPEDLVPVALWTTPRFMSRRFETWFFAADLPPGASPVFAPDEVAAHRWLAPAEALEARADGEIDMWVPTSSVLEQLAAIAPSRAGDVAAAVRFGRIARPRVASEGYEVVRIEVGAAGAVPGRRGETVLLGRRDVVVLDPGDPSEDAVDAVLGAVDRRAGRISAIVLTRPDPDHAAGAEALAIPLGIPVLVAPGAGRHLPYEVVEVREGEELPADLRLRVRLGRPGTGRLEVDAPWANPPLSAG